MVRLRAHRNGSLRGLHWQHKTQDKNRLHSRNRSIFLRAGNLGLYQHSIAALEHAPIRFAFILVFMGAQTDTLQWRQISCSPLYLLRSIGSLEQFGKRSRSSYERACWIGDFRFVFVFVFSCLYTKLKNNTVLLIQYCSYHLPLKTVPYCSYPTNTKINNSTTVPLYTTSTYNSKTAVQYHMTPIFNSIVSYIHRSAPKSHTFSTASRSTLAARDLYCTPGTSINCPDISTLYRRYIYFYAASTASGHRWSPAATVYNFYAGTPTS